MAESLRAQRAAQLEAKKKKLEALRKRKEAQRASKEAAAALAVADENELPSSQEQPVMDDFIQSILKKEEKKEEELKAAKKKEEAEKKVEKEIVTLPEEPLKEVTLTLVPQVHASLHIEPTAAAAAAVTETYDKGTQTEEDITTIETIETEQRSLSPVKGRSSLPSSPAMSSSPVKKEERAVLSSEQKQEILASPAFNEFLSKTSRVAERAILSSVDITLDYANSSSSSVENDDIKDSMVKLRHTLRDNRWSNTRVVTSLDVSPFFPDLVLVSYGSSSSANNSSTLSHSSSDPDGVVLLWSLSFPSSAPEYVFTNQSIVTCAKFHQYDRHLVIGGTYGGQVVLWDTRSTAGGASSLHSTSNGGGGDGHTHPIYCIETAGTKSRHQLITASTDGRVCVWDLLDLSCPTFVIDLTTTSTADTAALYNTEISVTAMAIAQCPTKSMTLQLYVGAETGEIYKFEVDQEMMSSSTSSTVMTASSACPVHHDGPVTALSLSRDVLLSSSVDWSCKQWNLSDNSVKSFDAPTDYVYDVKWNPVAARCFVTVDGTGNLSLFNNSRTEEDTALPVAECKVSSSPHALNRVCWGLDGKTAISGDSNGNVYIHDVDKSLFFCDDDDDIGTE